MVALAFISILGPALIDEAQPEPGLVLLSKFVRESSKSRAFKELLESHKAYDRLIAGEELKSLVWKTCRVGGKDSVWKRVNWVYIPSKIVKVPGMQPLIMLEGISSIHTCFYRSDNTQFWGSSISLGLLRGKWSLETNSIYRGFIKDFAKTQAIRWLNGYERVRLTFLFSQLGDLRDTPKSLAILATIKSGKEEILFCDHGIIKLDKEFYQLDYSLWSALGLELGILEPNK